MTHTKKPLEVVKELEAETRLRDRFLKKNVGTAHTADTPALQETPPLAPRIKKEQIVASPLSELEHEPISISDEHFCAAMLDTGRPVDAYIKVFASGKNIDTKKMYQEIGRVLAKPAVKEYLNRARSLAAYEHSVTVQSQANKLQRVYEAAMADKKYSAAVSAITVQSRLYGLLSDANTVNNTNVNLMVTKIQQGRKRLKDTVILVNPKQGEGAHLGS